MGVTEVPVSVGLPGSNSLAAEEPAQKPSLCAFEAYFRDLVKSAIGFHQVTAMALSGEEPVFQPDVNS